MTQVLGANAAPRKIKSQRGVVAGVSLTGVGWVEEGGQLMER